MMTVDEFSTSVAKPAPPPGVSPALEALWWARKGQWDRAHGCVQQHEGTPDADVVHAHLHRQEGDLPNAGYWYRSAGRVMPAVSLDDEWTALAAEFLSA